MPTRAHAQKCRSIPGDPGWPSPDAWQALNRTVGDRLIATTPLAAPCHQPQFDAERCSYLREQLILPSIHVQSPSSVMAPLSQIGMCSPFDAPSQPCPLGNLVSYSINASSASDIAAGVRFAARSNIRLVIKNTGHSSSGQSTGKGALGIWTHHMNSIEPILNYSSPWYSGAALKMGAGVLAIDAYAAAHRHRHCIVGPHCPTVGMAGGFSQGGGHGGLTPVHGLGADNVLEWEVVTANGTHTRATPRTNADLYWALSGGGGGTYAVVVSMTMRMHREETPIGGAMLSFNDTAAPTRGAFWDAVDVALAHTLPIVDSDAYYAALVSSVGPPSSGLSAGLWLTAPGQSERRVRAHLQPIVARLEQHGIAYSLTASTERSFFAHFDRYHGEGAGTPPIAGSFLTPSRLLRRQSLVAAPAAAAAAAAEKGAETAPTRSSLTPVLRSIVAERGWLAMNLGIKTPPARAQVAPNSVHPAWRSARGLVKGWAPAEPGTAPATAMLPRAERLTRVVDPALAALAGPDAPPNLNEVDPALPDIVRATYGPQLERLRQIKRKYDPDDLFYAFAGVGSEGWALDVHGRLCRAG